MVGRGGERRFPLTMLMTAEEAVKARTRRRWSPALAAPAHSSRARRWRGAARDSSPTTRRSTATGHLLRGVARDTPASCAGAAESNSCFVRNAQTFGLQLQALVLKVSQGPSSY